MSETENQTQEPAWYEDLDDDTKGYLDNRGLTSGTIKDAVVASIKAHREAEKFLGVPSKELFRIPKDLSDPAWGTIFEKIGVPQKPEEYDLSTLEDGLPEFKDFLQKTMHEAKVSKDGANAFAKNFKEYMANQEKEEELKTKEIIANEKRALEEKWGKDFKLNVAKAEAMATKLGVDQKTIDVLTSVEGLGYAKVNEMFFELAQKTGEDKFVTNEKGGVLSPLGAEAKLKELKSDKAWVAKLLAGDRTATAEFNALVEQKVSGGS